MVTKGKASLCTLDVGHGYAGLSDRIELTIRDDSNQVKGPELHPQWPIRPKRISITMVRISLTMRTQSALN
jgi:hypothetical protein